MTSWNMDMDRSDRRISMSNLSTMQMKGHAIGPLAWRGYHILSTFAGPPPDYHQRGDRMGPTTRGCPEACHWLPVPTRVDLSWAPPHRSIKLPNLIYLGLERIDCLARPPPGPFALLVESRGILPLAFYLSGHRRRLPLTLAII